jgi:voltage-gated sodium channel
MAHREGVPAADDSLNQLDLVFVLFFTVELAVNLYANWFWTFVQNPWSLFDFAVVGLSLIGLAPIGLPLSLLLLLRCCRVLRVFGRFKAASGIFSALAKSAIPMASTFLIIFVLSSICECRTGGVVIIRVCGN